LFPVTIAFVLALFTPVISAASPQADPPFVTTTLSPNVMIIFDTSGSMRWKHSNISYPGEAVFVVRKSFYDSNSGNDTRTSVVQIADNVADTSDKWLTLIPIFQHSSPEGLVGHADISASVIISDIQSHLTTDDSSYDKSITYTDLSGTSHTETMKFFRGGWGNSRSAVEGSAAEGKLPGTLNKLTIETDRLYKINSQRTWFTWNKM
jgi:hypothetical protein